MDNLRAAWALTSDLLDPDPPAHQGFHLPPLPSLSMPQIMLRQARDPATPGQASLQSVLAVAPGLKNVHDVGLLTAPAHVDLVESASHPIMQTLGLKPSQGAELGFYVLQDFEVGPARRLD
jgi:hypothetical protein